MKRPRHVLLIDDHFEDRALVTRELVRKFADLQIREITGAAAFKEALDRGDFDLAITECKLHWSEGLKVLEEIKSRRPECPVIMVTGSGNEEIAVAAMKAGVDDYINKSFQYVLNLPKTVGFLLERNREQQARRQAEARYARLFERVPVGLYRITLGGKILDANLALAELLGYGDREELLAVNARYLYVHAGDRQKWRRLMEQEGVVRDFEVQLRHRDGSVIWVRNNAQAIRDERGRIICYEGSAEDITTRKQAEEAERENERFLASIFDSIQDGLCILDNDLTIIRANPAMKNWYPHAVPLEGKRCYQAIHNADKPCEVCAAQHTRDTGEPTSKVVPKRGLGGRQVGWLEIFTFPLTDITTGTVKGMIEYVRDISARRRAEMELQETNEFLRSLLQASAAGIVYLDRQGRVCIWNEAATRIFGWEAEEVMGRPLPCIPQDRQEEFQELRKQALEGEAFTGVETQRQKKNGSLIEVSLSLAPVQNTQGEVQGTLTIITDITLRKQAEEALRQKEEQLQQAQKMEAVGRLAGGVAHDFNNLLTAIMGYCELLLLGLQDQEQSRMVDQIMQVSERAAILIRQLLAFSHRQPLKPGILDLTQVVGDLEKLLQRVIGEDILLKITHEEAPSLVQADQAQVEQVIVNLAVNAREAMPLGGRLNIKTSKVSLGESEAQAIPEARPGDFVVLEVTDTGPGIDKEVRKRIFEPFFTTKGPGEGTGLGLSLVYGIVKRHEGWVEVYSEPGEGTAFRIYLPAAVTPPRNKPRRGLTLAELRGRGERILVVEDEEKVREIAGRMLRQKGYEVVTAATVAEAVTIFAKEQGNFQLLFSDVVLADQSGLQLVEELRNRKPDLKVLLTSGYADHKVQWPLIQKEEYPFLQKPYSLQNLLQAITKVLESGAG